MWITARAKGLQYWKLILRYPVRLALNPFISTVGWVLPSLIAGETIVSVVLSLPTAGPLFLQALLEEDMYLAGSFVLLAASLTVIGTLLSDILLAVIDPESAMKERIDAVFVRLWLCLTTVTESHAQERLRSHGCGEASPL